MSINDKSKLYLSKVVVPARGNDSDSAAAHASCNLRPYSIEIEAAEKMIAHAKKTKMIIKDSRKQHAHKSGIYWRVVTLDSRNDCGQFLPDEHRAHLVERRSDREPVELWTKKPRRAGRTLLV